MRRTQRGSYCVIDGAWAISGFTRTGPASSRCSDRGLAACGDDGTVCSLPAGEEGVLIVSKINQHSSRASLLVNGLCGHGGGRARRVPGSVVLFVLPVC
jgi:hypothetical protein